MRTAGNPHVSVVMPTFNRASDLDRVLTRLEQIVEPRGGFEVIVVDDGSTDESNAVLMRHPKVKAIRQVNSGPAAARNRGWHAANGEIVVFTDDDVLPGSEWLVELCRPFYSDPKLGGVGGSIQPMIPGHLADFVQDERHVGHGMDESVRYLVTANAAYRRRALERVGGFDEAFTEAAGEDVDLSQRVLAAGYGLEVVDSATVFHDHRTGFRAIIRHYRRAGRARARLAQEHPAMGVKAYATERSSHDPLHVRRYRASGYGPLKVTMFAALRSVCILVFAFGVIEYHVTTFVAQRATGSRG